MLLREYNSFISVSPLWATQLTAGLPTFADEKIYKPLQAADMLAWHARRYYYDLSCGKEPEASGYCWKQGGDSDDIAGPNRCIDNLIPPKKNKSVWANQRSSNPDSESNSI